MIDNRTDHKIYLAEVTRELDRIDRRNKRSTVRSNQKLIKKTKGSRSERVQEQNAQRSREILERETEKRRINRAKKTARKKAEKAKAPIENKRKFHDRYPRYELGMSVEFYRTREWMEVRYEALKKCGASCACCGARGKDVILHVDHIKPRSRFPMLELELDNLQVLCELCNIGKGNRDTIDWQNEKAKPGP